MKRTCARHAAIKMRIISRSTIGRGKSAALHNVCIFVHAVWRNSETASAELLVPMAHTQLSVSLRESAIFCSDCEFATDLMSFFLSTARSNSACLALCICIRAQRGNALKEESSVHIHREGWWSQSLRLILSPQWNVAVIKAAFHLLYTPRGSQYLVRNKSITEAEESQLT